MRVCAHARAAARAAQTHVKAVIRHVHARVVGLDGAEGELQG